MSERRQRLVALGPPYPGIEHPRCRVCYRFADYTMQFTGGRKFRSASRTYCTAHLLPAYQPFKEEADQQLAARWERAQEREAPPGPSETKGE